MKLSPFRHYFFYAKKAFKPFDVVLLEDGSVGFIQEVNLNKCQTGFNSCVSYSIHWFRNTAYNKSAWFNHSELEGRINGNFMIEVAKCMCHPFGSSSGGVDMVFGKAQK